jgi:LPXTG-motif cell wall-anchored protein
LIKRITAALALAFALTGATGSPVYATEGSPSPSASASASASPSASASASASPSPSAPAAKPCEAYLYYGTSTNLCADFPGPADRDCKDIGYRVQLVKVGVDPWELDGIRGGPRGRPGVGCDSLPRKPVTSASASPSPSRSTSAAAAGDGTELPLTGPTTGIAIGVGALLLTTGVVVLLAQRRRRTTFRA